jgi:hypothetical protein
MEKSWKDTIVTGVGAGILWGWVAMAVNSVTGIFPFEASFAHNIVSFTFGGAVFGVVAGALMNAVGRVMPFRRVLPRAILISAVLWVVLWIGGSMLSVMEPHRYHLLMPQTLQGLVLALILGTVLGAVWKKGLLPSK